MSLDAPAPYRPVNFGIAASATSHGTTQTSDYELAARRRARSPNNILPYAAPNTPTLGQRLLRPHPSGSNRALITRRRALVLLTAVSVTLFVLLSDSRRTRAHGLLTAAGVPLPSQLPDSLHALLDSINTPQDLKYVPPSSNSNTSPDQVGSPHTWHSNGQLVLHALDTYKDGVAQHPIAALIKRAEGEWKRKVEKQSRTLKECVEEYRRRYRRNPPAGFDLWWDYAKENKITLTDEYDQIYKDILPFWALEPDDFRRRIKQMAEREETFTITVTGGVVRIAGPEAGLKRASDLAALMERFAKSVPNLVMSFTKHDQPAVQMGWFHKERMVELAQLGEHYGVSEFVQESNLPLSNWANGCPPETALRQAEEKLLTEHPSMSAEERHKKLGEGYVSALSKSRSFIYDHARGMDICLHPEVMRLHGFTTAIGTNEGPLMPLFTFAKTNVHSDVLATPLEQYSATYIGYDADWDRKTKNQLMWRGSTTGADFLESTEWRQSQRARLHFLTHQKKGAKKVWTAQKDGKVEEHKVEVGDVNPAWFDTSFSGSPVQCDKKTCAIMEKEIDFKPTMGLDEAYEYKYVMDVDGNGWSGRFHRLMSMKAMTLKSSLFPEWYTDRVQPWVHYVPVKVDYSDLHDIMAFFVGRPGKEAQEGHDELAKRIGAAGKDWAANHWREEDMAGYMFRLSLEWARLMNQDSPGSHDFEFAPTWLEK